MGFLLIIRFFDNLFHLFSNGKIQIQLEKEKDQHHNLATSAYGYYDQLEAFKNIDVIFKTLPLRCAQVKIWQSICQMIWYYISY